MNGYYDFERGCFYDGEHLSRLKRKFSQISISLLIYIFVSSLAIFFIQILVSLFGLSKVLDQSIYWQWGLSLLPLYIFGFPCAYWFLKKNTRAIAPRRKKMEIGDLLLLFLIGRFFTLLGSTVSSFLVSFVETIGNNPVIDYTSELINAAPWWLILIGAVIIGPIVEEIIFRKLIIDRLHEHGEAVAILFSSLVFALAHGNFYQVVYSFLNGCILGLIYLRSGNIKYSIAFHMVTNFLGSIVVLPIINAQIRLEALFEASAITSEYLSLSMLVSGYGIAKIILAFLGAIVFILYYKKFLPSPLALDPLPHGRALRIALINPGFLGFFIISAFEFWLNLF